MRTEAIKRTRASCAPSYLNHGAVKLSIMSLLISGYFLSSCAHFDVLSLCLKGKECSLHVLDENE